MTEDITPGGTQAQMQTDSSSGSPIAGIRQWLIDSYNGIFRIVVQPQLPKLRVILFIIIAVLFGMFWAYSIRPTQFYNAAPHQLSQTARDQWVKFVAASYDAGFYTPEQARVFLEQIENPAGTIERLIGSEDPAGQVRESLIRLQTDVVQGIGVGSGTPAPTGGSIVTSVLDFVLGVVVYVVIVLVFAIAWGLLIGGFFERAYLAIKKRVVGESEADKRARDAIESIRQRKELEAKMREEAAQEAASPLGPPIMQRISPYQKGRAYDDSFAIEDANDMFLGECGATIAKTIGDSQELAAVEIWLFDKDDFVRTLTKLFVSEHIYNDPVARSELNAKVENPETDIVVASPGATLVLESDNIRCQAKIADLTYGSVNGLPSNSHFDSLTIRMEAWQKQGGGSGTPSQAPVPAAAGGLPSLDSYEIGSPPPMPSGSTTGPTTPASPAPQPPSSPPPGSRPLDSYEIGPPPQMPSGRTPPPPPGSTPGDEEDDDPFGGTGDFTPIGN